MTRNDVLDLQKEKGILSAESNAIREESRTMKRKEQNIANLFAFSATLSKKEYLNKCS